jgi:glycosyltransferase 2 family protein
MQAGLTSPSNATAGSFFPRRYLIGGVKFLISFGLLWLLFSRIDIGRMATIIRQASPAWLIAAVGAYTVSVLVSIWRWHRLLEIQNVRVSRAGAGASFMVALFFNNFLPSNVGGDVIRISDTARPAGSNTMAATIVLVDRVIGLLGLILFAAFSATIGALTGGGGGIPMSLRWIWGGLGAGIVGSLLAMSAPAGIRRALRPVTSLTRGWVGSQLETLVRAMTRFRSHPLTLVSCLAAAVFVQVSNVLFYAAIAYALHVDIGVLAMAVIVPVSSLAQALPISINGFGVREAAFSVMFARVGLPVESALVVSLAATALIMSYSLTGAAVYVARRRRPTDIALNRPELQTVSDTPA